VHGLLNGHCWVHGPIETAVVARTIRHQHITDHGHCNFVHMYPLAPKKSINLHWVLLASEHPKLLQNIGTSGSLRERPHPTRKEPAPPIFACPIARTPRCVPPNNRTRFVSPDHHARMQEPMWVLVTYPCLWMLRRKCICQP
jgi:hypothetical protein